MLNIDPNLLAQLQARSQVGNIEAQVLLNVLEAVGHGVSSTQALSSPGAIAATARNVRITANNAGDVVSLADGIVVGQRKSITLVVRTHVGVDTAVITPADGGPWTLTLVNDNVEIEWDGTNWVLVQDNRGGSVTPLDTTASDITAVGAAKVAGAVGKAADSGHVHQLDKSCFHVVYVTGVAAAGPATATGVKAGDQVLAMLDLTAAPLVNGAGNFESTITVNGQIQQSSASDLHLHTYLLIVVAKS